MTVYNNSGRNRIEDGVSSLGGAYSFVAQTTISGAAATTITVSGLDLATDEKYLVEFVTKNPTGSTTFPSLYYNGDTTATNYHVQLLTGNNTTVAGQRANDAILGGMLTTENYTCSMEITRDLDGNPRCLYRCNRGPGSAMIYIAGIHVRNNTANVTSITISNSVASSLGVGAYLRVWKVQRQLAGGSAGIITYDNATSGLTATNVQDAIDELAPVLRVQATDLVITSDNVFQDTDLSAPLVAGTYLIEIEETELAHATPDMETRPNYTGTVTSVRENIASTTSGGAAAGVTATSLTTAVMTGTLTYWRRRVLYIILADAGTFSFQARQVTSSGTTVTFYKGSFMRVTRLA